MDVAEGIVLPYQTIAIHALKKTGEGRPAVWMQLQLGEEEDDEDGEPVSLTLVPTSSAVQAAEALFHAVATCSALHGDGEEDEEDGDDRIVFEGGEVEGLPGVMRGVSAGGLPPPMPGSNVWFTAENVDQYFDEDGNFLEGQKDEEEELGEGAGRVRGREEEREEGVDGKEEESESKRARVD